MRLDNSLVTSTQYFLVSIILITTNAPLLRTPTRRVSFLCESGPIYIVSFNMFSWHNSLKIWGKGLKCLHTSIFIETPSLEGLPNKPKEDPSPHKMRLYPAGRQPSISWSRGNYYYSIFIVIIIIIIIIFIISSNLFSCYFKLNSNNFYKKQSQSTSTKHKHQ